MIVLKKNRKIGHPRHLEIGTVNACERAREGPAGDRRDGSAPRMKSKTNSSADALVGDNTPDMFPVFRDCVDPSLIPASDGWEAARGGIGRVFLPFKKLHPVFPPPDNAPVHGSLGKTTHEEKPPSRYRRRLGFSFNCCAEMAISPTQPQ